MNARAWCKAVPWLLLLAVGLAAGWLRYGLIESAAMGQRCGVLDPPWWCSARQWLVIGFLDNVYGVAAIAAAALALLRSRPWLAWLAAALGVFALELYCFETGALALLVGCLRLLRLQAATQPGPLEQYRQRDRRVENQP